MDHILIVLKWTGYNRSDACKVLGVSIRTLRTYIKEYVASGFYIPTSLEYRHYGVDAQRLKGMSEKDLNHISTPKDEVEEAPVEIDYTYDYFASNEERLHYRNTGKRLNSGEST